MTYRIRAHSARQPLGHKDIDELVGMNFLRHFNFEIRPADRQIVVELLARG